jgi:hypothetical protein
VIIKTQQRRMSIWQQALLAVIAIGSPYLLSNNGSMLAMRVELEMPSPA